MKLGVSLRHLRSELADFRHWARLWWLGAGHDDRYRRYLRVQLERTLSKRSQLPGMRTRLMVDHVIELGAPRLDARVLCVGCRNTAEIECFRSKGLLDVVGIDLFSESPDILVMDMHCMTFPDAHFDIVYASHSLEHAYDVHRVANEIIRVARPNALVAIEVPVAYRTRGADVADFRSLGNVHTLFQPHIARVLWSDEQPPHTAWNDSGTPIARTVFTLCKNPHSAYVDSRK